MSSSPRRSGGRPAHEAASPSALAPAILRWAKARQIDVAVLADRAGLDLDLAAVAEADELPITSTALARLFDLTAEISGEPRLGIRLPTELVFRRYDAGALAARVAATPRDVLLAIARYSALVFPRLEAKVVEEEEEDQENSEPFAATNVVRFDLTIAGAPRGLGHHVDSYLLAFVLGHCRRGGTTVVPRSVRLLSARPSTGDLGSLVHTFGTEDIEFGCESTGLTLDKRETASRALPSFDPMLVAAAEQLASAALKTAPRASVAFATTVEARIETMLLLSSSSPPTGGATTASSITAETVAAAMKMSGRTMQRRLEDEGGARFSVLFDQVRERLAKELLQNEATPLTEIAYRVGFSDIATFSRAFKRWTGMPPGAYRRTTTTATTTTTTTKRAF